MHENDGCRAVQNRPFARFTGMNDRGRQASHANSVVADGPVLAVERYHTEMLAVEDRQLLPERVK